MTHPLDYIQDWLDSWNHQHLQWPFPRLIQAQSFTDTRIFHRVLKPVPFHADEINATPAKNSFLFFLLSCVFFCNLIYSKEFLKLFPTVSSNSVRKKDINSFLSVFLLFFICLQNEKILFFLLKYSVVFLFRFQSSYFNSLIYCDSLWLNIVQA